MKVGYPVDDDDVGTPALVDNGGTYAVLTSAMLGGGVQYTEGATDASITGTALMWEDAADAVVAASAAKPLPVNVVSGVSGTEYTEATEVAAPSTGPVLMLKRDDVLSSLPAGTIEGDATPALCNANGALWFALDSSTPPSVAISGIPHVEVDSRPALDNTTDAVTAVPHSGALNVGLAEKPVTKANVTLAADGTIIAAQGAGNKIRVTEIFIYPQGGANTYEIEDGAGGTVLFGPISLAANQGLRLKSDHGLFADGTANTLLHLDQTAGTSTLVLVSYIVVT